MKISIKPLRLYKDDIMIFTYRSDLLSNYMYQGLGEEGSEFILHDKSNHVVLIF